jgi:aspartyl/asparaginyl-tRNA synthetase
VSIESCSPSATASTCYASVNPVSKKDKLDGSSSRIFCTHRRGGHAQKGDYRQKVRVCGWVRTRRDSKGGFSFIEINDGSTFDSVQVLAEKTLPNYEDEILKLGIGSSVEVIGNVVESPGKEQTTEVKAESVKVLGFADPATYPLQKKRYKL